MRFGLMLVSFLGCVQLFLAQQPSHFFLGKEEFEGVQIYDVIQDNNLNYWFATDQGFYKYNGYNFVTVEFKGAKGQSAFGFVKNKQGVIFCYNLNNQILKIENDTCSVFYELKKDERASDVYLGLTANNYLLVLTKKALLFDNKGNKQTFKTTTLNYYGFPFKLTDGRTICHISGKDSILVVKDNTITKQALQNQNTILEGILKFFRINSSVFAINVIDKKLYAFNESDFSLELIKNQPAFSKKEFYRFYNENNQLWVAGTISGTRVIKQPNTQPNTELFFSNYLISDVFKDTEGNILLSTFNQGIIVIPNMQIPDVLPLSNQQSIVSICNDSELGLLLGTINGQLLLYNNFSYKSICNEGSRPLQAIFSWPNFPYVLFDDGFLKAYHKKTGKIIPLFNGSLKDATLINDSSLCLALNTGVCKVVFNNKEKFVNEPLLQLQIRAYAVGYEHNTKCLFVASSDGLKKITPEGGVSAISFNNEPVFVNDISIANGLIYLASKEKGILIFKNGEVIKQINPTLKQKTLEAFKIKVVKNKIYINSSQGFVVMTTDGNIINQLSKVQGFSTNKLFDFDLFDNELWVAHSKGVQKLNLAELTDVTPKPLMQITNIAVNDKPLYDIINLAQFKSNERKFLFTFSSPTLRHKENIQYHYKLVGYDLNWQTTAYSNHSIIYNALEPGNYTFMVKAENQKNFSETASFTFVILKPIYARWWFILLCSILGFMLIVFIYRRQLMLQQKKSKQINELNSSKLTAIQSQMNPHFIFNSLNSIQDLVLKGDVENSYSYITTFSDLVRRTLSYSEKEFIEFEQEIKLLNLYLSLEKLRFKKNFSFEINTQHIEDIMIPPMLIQPFIENSLAHGLLHKEGEKKLKIIFELKNNLICQIEDNGIGREKAKAIKQRQNTSHESFSGKAIGKRFEILSNVFEKDFGYRYEDLYVNGEPAGTRVVLTIPIKRKF